MYFCEFNPRYKLELFYGKSLIQASVQCIKSLGL